MNEMMNSNSMATAEQFPIFELPGRPPFMLARDVASAYGVEVRELNKARSNNPKKFFEGEDYFQLTNLEVENIHNKKQKGHLPFGYTKKAAHMFATILSTDESIAMAIRIVEGFLAFENSGKQLLPQEERLRRIVREELANFIPPSRASKAVTSEEKAALKADILAGAGTKATARKYNRAVSTVMVHTKAERAIRNKQLMLPGVDVKEMKR